jgi:glutamate dehydrogenase
MMLRAPVLKRAALVNRIAAAARHSILIPGSHNLGSFGDTTAWQAHKNVDIQRVTQTAIIHELTQQQVHTIETTVPWFLKNMPASYFRQVPEEFRMDHIKAIAAIKDANMDCKLQRKVATRLI